MKIRLQIAMALFVLTAFMTAGAISAQQGPSVNETVEWLNSHKSSITCPDYVQIHTSTFRLKNWSQIVRTGECRDGGVDPEAALHPEAGTWSDVTSITVATVTHRDADGPIIGYFPRIEIRFKGGTNWIAFDDGTSRDVATRFAKALSHLAELNGAKLVKDDLF